MEGIHSAVALRSSLLVPDSLAYVAWPFYPDSSPCTHCLAFAAVVVDNDMLDPDSSHMECVGLDSLLALVVADHMGQNSAELAARACHTHADQHDGLAESPDASSLVHRDWGLGSLNVAVRQRVESTPVPDLESRPAYADIAAEVHPYKDHWMLDGSSPELPSAAFVNA